MDFLNTMDPWGIILSILAVGMGLALAFRQGQIQRKENVKVDPDELAVKTVLAIMNGKEEYGNITVNLPTESGYRTVTFSKFQEAK